MSGRPDAWYIAVSRSSMHEPTVLTTREWKVEQFGTMFTGRTIMQANPQFFAPVQRPSPHRQLPLHVLDLVLPAIETTFH